MRNSILGSILLALVLSGCGTAGPSLTAKQDESVRPRRMEARDASYHFDIPAEGEVHSVRIPGTPQTILPFVAKAYEELGIPIELMDTRNFLIGNIDYRARRRVGEIPMRDIVDCGTTVSGSRADRDIVTFDLRTQVKRVTIDEVALETIVIATARTTAGVSTNEVNCSSRGKLEQYIANSVRLLILSDT